jgi:tetraacyldisaccharide 4'-kinase
MANFSNFINYHWYSKRLTWLTIILYPVSFLFGVISFIRCLFLKLCYGKKQQVKVPIIVVGNISVGGVGKTPLVESLVLNLKQRGYKPGIISRGYGGHSPSCPLEVKLDGRFDVYGDEPYMLKESLLCPIVISSNRVKAARHISEEYNIDVIISDDGLQHYKMYRDIEIAVVDGVRLLGNGKLLPAGPLREGKRRLKSVDYILMNGGDREVEGSYLMKTKALALVNLLTGKEYDPQYLNDYEVHAVAGIGNPEKFFQDLIKHKYSIIKHAFTDHHKYTKKDFEGYINSPIIMTHKDAIKCKFLKKENIFYLKIGVDICEKFYDAINQNIKELTNENMNR